MPITRSTEVVSDIRAKAKNDQMKIYDH